jgi:two-component system invasion response regulator UvrY
MIKVALADDHVILRKGVAEIISKFDGMTVTVEAGTGKELLTKMEKADTLPDVCVIDINMPEMNGYDATAAVRNRWPQVKVLALSMYDTELNIIRMLRAGANGYVLKDNDPEDLRNAIRGVMVHHYYHSDLVSGRLLHQIQSSDDKLVPEINDREFQFLQLCCSELTYKEIAEQMYLSPRTIDGYREALFDKLGVTSRTGLVMYAMKAGLAN